MSILYSLIWSLIRH